MARPTLADYDARDPQPAAAATAGGTPRAKGLWAIFGGLTIAALAAMGIALASNTPPPMQLTLTAQTTVPVVVVATPSDEQVKAVLTRVAPSATPVVLVITATPYPTMPPTLTPIATVAFTATQAPTSTPTPGVKQWCIAMSTQYLAATPSDDPRFHAGYVLEGEAVGILEEGMTSVQPKDWVKVLVRRGDAESRGWLRLAFVRCP